MTPSQKPNFYSIQIEVDELLKITSTIDANVLKDKFAQITSKLKGIQGRRTDQLLNDLKTLEVAVNKLQEDHGDDMDTSTGGDNIQALYVDSTLSTANE